ncbi:unnamed protein product [Rotaria sordida]|uniref:Uncharacterized protein n=1 Tax=Rotaria sordida TaxID=392033 RepID=A0A814V1I9_9BILA|nr:unnamed protein product [Rotaria sordida]CAF1185095.1 unnamed protein product [Rotaria sordida]CAF1447969.1 unnamed protein product [Rotaria sordida]CAF3936960.1 unnamed protein product [Rotaria sordida]
MNTADVGYSVETDRSVSAAAQTPYESSSPNISNKFKNALNQKYERSVRFFNSIYGILNVITIVALVGALISAGLASSGDARLADSLPNFSKAKVSAFHTRNAVLVFASAGLFLILVDTILQMTGLIKRLPVQFDSIFTIIMFVVAAIFLILGCCAAAWGKKMNDSPIARMSSVRNTAAAAITAIFLFIAMIAIIINFVLRLIRPTERGNDG